MGSSTIEVIAFVAIFAILFWDQISDGIAKIVRAFKGK